MTPWKPGWWILVAAGAAAIAWYAPEAINGWERVVLAISFCLAMALGAWVNEQGLHPLGGWVAMVVYWTAYGLWVTNGKLGGGAYIGGFFVGLALFGAYCVRWAESRKSSAARKP